MAPGRHAAVLPLSGPRTRPPHNFDDGTTVRAETAARVSCSTGPSVALVEPHRSWRAAQSVDDLPWPAGVRRGRCRRPGSGGRGGAGAAPFAVSVANS